MPARLILAIDQGTTNTKALLVDSSGAPVFRASTPVALIHVPPGFVEQDPLQLWDSVKKVIAECMAYADQAAPLSKDWPSPISAKPRLLGTQGRASQWPMQSVGSVDGQLRFATAWCRVQIYPQADRPAACPTGHGREVDMAS